MFYTSKLKTEAMEGDAAGYTNRITLLNYGCQFNGSLKQTKEQTVN